MQNPSFRHVRVKRPGHLQTHTKQKRQKGETTLGPEPQEQSLLEQHIFGLPRSAARGQHERAWRAGVITPVANEVARTGARLPIL
eukprot:SAG31_NODE_3214_length_4535_cov_2.601306_4_plen_85_part_00